jgi:hypothetical protein
MGIKGKGLSTDPSFLFTPALKSKSILRSPGLHQAYFLPVTGVDPLRGFIRPALRANRVEAPKDIENRFLSLKPVQSNPKRLGR